MNKQQRRQLYILNFMGKKEGLISAKKLILGACDTCREFAVNKRRHEARNWLLKHENHLTRIWIEKSKEKAGNKVDLTEQERTLNKVEKLYKLAKETSYPEEAEAALLKAHKLLKDYGLVLLTF